MFRRSFSSVNNDPKLSPVPRPVERRVHTGELHFTNNCRIYKFLQFAYLRKRKTFQWRGISLRKKRLSAEKKQKRNLSVTTLKDSEFRFPGKEKNFIALFTIILS